MSDTTTQQSETALIPAYRDTFVHYLFATPGNEDCLLDLLNAFLEDDGQPLVKSAEPKNPFNPQTFITDKYSILDVKATDESGEVFVIEFQTSERAEFANRMLYYCCKAYCMQMTEGQNYSILRWVIGIAITTYALCNELEGVHNSFHLVAKANPNCIFADEGIQMHTLELTDEKRERFGQLKPRLRLWAMFFYQSHLKTEAEMTALLQDNPVILKAYKKYRYFNDNEQLRALDDRRQQYLLDYATDMAHGRKEEKLEIAHRLKSRGMSDADIADCTGLSTDEVNRLS
jgi:predicted transposase/invertase (TIGR01784 family)